jgi:hypothetical protein
VKDPVRAAEAILASARLNEMSHEYAPALAPPSPRATAYNTNPLRYKATMVGRAISNARSIGAGMCEFEAINLVGRNADHVRCVAPARIAIHIRSADTIEMVGTLVQGEFNVEDVHATH